MGWALAGDTPFQWTKQIASHYGGTRNGAVIVWPARITDAGGIRSQWHHVIDVTPTILEAAKLPQPKFVDGIKQKPIEGVSMVYTFADSKAPSRHHTQYFEMFGNRGIYSDGWTAVTRHSIRGTSPLRRRSSPRIGGSFTTPTTISASHRTSPRNIPTSSRRCSNSF